MQKKFMRGMARAGLGVSVLAAATLAGCGGGSSNNNNGGNGGGNGNPGTNFFGLLSDGVSLVSFNSSNTTVATRRTISGLPAGVTLRGIDARVAPMTGATGNGINAIYAVGSNNQVYVLTVAGAGNVTATAVGNPYVFDGFIPAGGAYGIDFNPTVDRIRVANAANQNSRLNPNDGTAVDGDTVAAGTNPDGPLAYDAADPNNGQDPAITAAAYTNNDLDATTGTINYAIDSASNRLVTQGRPNTAAAGQPDNSVSPNSGRLFTIGALGANFGGDAGLEIFGTNNAAVAVSGRNFYTVNLQTGAATLVGRIGEGNQAITDITVAP